MPKHIPALATRAAVVATATAFVAVLPAAPTARTSAPPADLAAGTSAQLAAPVAGASAQPVAPAAGVLAAPSPTVSPVAPVAHVSPAPAVAVPTAASASALSAAMSKIGAPYRWGATGPNAFDCSGLVSWAFKKSGVPLPRTSRAMSQVGAPVSKGDLRAGDLVFFYKPVSHVAIYVGQGKVVHASSSGNPVKISDMNRMPFNSARRV